MPLMAQRSDINPVRDLLYMLKLRYIFDEIYPTGVNNRFISYRYRVKRGNIAFFPKHIAPIKDRYIAYQFNNVDIKKK